MQKRVFITGGARGIGRSIVVQYQQAGYEVISPTRTELDLASVTSIKDYLARHNSLNVDVLINNAGENRINALENIEIEQWQRIQMVNLTAPFMLIQHMTPYMLQQGWGRIVNISTIYSLLSRAGRAPYSTSKAGLNALTRTAALEYANGNVLANSICPGFVETDLTHQNNTPAQIEALRAQIPLGRLATTSEIAELTFFLGSERNTYITGQTIIIDGGFTLQ
jgi:3-oxoacyl-[acyl-carrier protein] reductase